MTVSSTERFQSFVPDGIVKSFDFTFRCNDPAWISIEIDTVEVGGYSVTLNADQEADPGGTVDFVVAPTGTQLVVIRNTDLTQQTEYNPFGRFPASSHEAALDKLAMAIQDFAELATRVAQYPIGVDPGLVVQEFPPYEANSFWVWHPTEAGVVINLSLDGLADSPVSAAMAPVVAAATIPLARAGLGATALGDLLFTAPDIASVQALLDVVTIEDDQTINGKKTMADVFRMSNAIFADNAVNYAADTVNTDTYEVSPAVDAALGFGTAVTVFITNPNTVSNPTLKWGSMAASPIYRKGANPTVLNAGDISGLHTFLWLAGSWLLLDPHTVNISAALAGNPTTTTQAFDNNSTRVATTAHVTEKLAGLGTGRNIIAFGCRNPGASTTRYMGPLGTNAQNSETAVACYAPFPITIKNLFGYLNAANAAATPVVFTVRKLGAASAVTCSVAAAAQSANDVVNSVDIDAGEYFAIEAVFPAGFGGTNDASASIEVFKQGTDEPACFYPLRKDPAGASRIGHPSAVTTAFAFGGIVTAATLLGWTPSMDAGSAYVYRNGAAIPQNFITNKERSAAAGALYESTINAAGTVVGAFRFRPVKAPYPTTAAVPVMPFLVDTQGGASTRYAGGLDYNTQQATEADAQVPMPACTVSKLRFYADASFTGTITVRKNGVATAVIVNPAAAITGADLVNSVAFAAGDLLSIEVVNNSGGNRSVSISIEVGA